MVLIVTEEVLPAPKVCLMVNPHHCRFFGKQVYSDTENHIFLIITVIDDSIAPLLTEYCSFGKTKVRRH